MSGSISNQKERKIYIFQFLRGLACLGVCFSHLILPDSVNIFLQTKLYFNIGMIFGVGIFFFISGFLIIMSLEKSQDIKSFAIRRIFRIYPVLIFITILTSVFTCVYKISSIDLSPTHFSMRDFLLQIFLIRDYVNKPGLVASEWTLLVEIKFYFIMMVTYYVYCKLSNRTLIKMFGIYIAALLILILLPFYCLFKTTDIIEYLSYCKQFLAEMLIMFSGCVYYYYYTKKISHKELYVYMSSLILFLIALYSFNLARAGIVPYITQNVMWLLPTFIGQILSIFVSIIIIENAHKIKYNKTMNFVGEISYPLYLIHNTFNVIAFSFLVSHIFKITIPINEGTKGLFFIIFSIPVSYFIHLYIEKPAINFSKGITSCLK